MRKQLVSKLCTDGANSKEIRCKLLKHYSQGKESKDLRLSSFLDVILDDHLDEITAAFDDEDGHWDEEIVPTIVSRSPSVRTLNLHWAEKTHPYLTETLSSDLSRLRRLTSLNLHQLPEQCKSIAFCIGRSCPTLQNLRLGFSSSTLTSEELIRIFYSADLAALQQAAAAAPNQPARAYHTCQVSARMLYPFCQTLQKVRVNRTESPDADLVDAIAFLLRHLPRLQELETSDFEFTDYSASIRALWEIRHPEWNQSEASASDCIRCLAHHPLAPSGTAPSSVFDAHPDVILPAYYNGSLRIPVHLIINNISSNS